MHPANHLDPLTRQPARGVSGAGLSPMDPPEAYSPPGTADLDAPTHPFLEELRREHAALSEEMRALEEVIGAVPETGFTEHVERRLLAFCGLLEAELIPHSRREETVLFPLLHERLLAAGEHSKGRVPTTAVDRMQDEHVTIVQLVAVIANFLKIASHLPDERSALVVRDAALRHAVSLVELLRLHMFREDTVVFALAQRLISVEELDRMKRR